MTLHLIAMPTCGAGAFACAIALVTPLAHAAPPAPPPAPPSAAQAMAAQRAALQPLAMLDGVWRGPATVYQEGGQALQLTQTERVGSLLGGSIKLIEGRGYGADGSLGFNAFAVVSYEPQTGSYNFRSHAMGHAGDFPFEVRPDGFRWSIQAGPTATIRYTTTVKDGVWAEIGERLVDGQPPVRMFEMRLLRVADSAWPEGGAVPPK